MEVGGHTVLMVMLDAFRHDYISQEDCPFLHSLAQAGGWGSLKPSFGFEPDGAYLAGLTPSQCDGGAQYWLNPSEKVFRLMPLFRVLNGLSGSAWWRRNIRRAIRLAAQVWAKDSMTKRLAPPSEIPLGQLPRFSFPMKKMADEEGFIPGRKTIFDILRERGKKYYCNGFPEHSTRAADVADRYLAKEDGSSDLAFLFISDLDGVGHAYGPDSPERRSVLREVDRQLARIVEHARSLNGSVSIMAFGDHGMAAVTGCVDLSPCIREMDFGKDEAFFLDSTMARFWVGDADRRDRLVRLLNEVPGGHVLTEEEVRQYAIEYDHNFYGDVFFVVDDGLVVHPSFYAIGSRGPKGMHGYLPECRDTQSAFILVHGDESRGDLGCRDMRSVFPTVLAMLGVGDAAGIPEVPSLL